MPIDCQCRDFAIPSMRVERAMKALDAEIKKKERQLSSVCSYANGYKDAVQEVRAMIRGFLSEGRIGGKVIE